MKLLRLIKAVEEKPQVYRISYKGEDLIESYKLERAEDLSELDCKFSKLAYDSREVQEDTAFFALRGRSLNGEKFIPQAIRSGARLIFAEAGINAVEELLKTEHLPEDVAVIYVQVPDARQALAEISAAFYDYPAKKLIAIGITGTKGKSSLAHLLTQALELNAHKVILIGTTGIHFAGRQSSTDNTTPESLIIQKELAKAVKEGASHLVIELSSQALAMGRAEGLELDLACFLNLSADHIGPLEHPDFADYKKSKLKIFSLAKNALINLDDQAALAMLETAAKSDLRVQNSGRISAFSLRPRDDALANLAKLKSQARFSEDLKLYTVEALCLGADELQFKFAGKNLSLQPAASFLAANALAALAAMDCLGELNEQIIEALPGFRIPGRLESIALPNGARVIIDYAHNALSLTAVLTALRPQVKGQLAVLFGSVGDKTVERRRELAEVAEAYADRVYVSSDNPANEEPLKIVREIAANFSPEFTNYRLIPDREEAIRLAIRELKSGDLLVLAGKGHEKFQLIKGEHIPFNEQAIVESEIKEMQK